MSTTSSYTYTIIVFQLGGHPSRLFTIIFGILLLPSSLLTTLPQLQNKQGYPPVTYDRFTVDGIPSHRLGTTRDSLSLDS